MSENYTDCFSKNSTPKYNAITIFLALTITIKHKKHLFLNRHPIPAGVKHRLQRCLVSSATLGSQSLK